MDGRYAEPENLGDVTNRPRTRALTHRELVDAMHSVLNDLGNIYEVDLKTALP